MSASVRRATRAGDFAIELSHLTKTYAQWQRSFRLKDLGRSLLRPQTREVHALQDVSLTVRRGEFVAYAGPNGAGKSTTMKLLSGMLAPTSGDAYALGLHPRKARIQLMKRAGVLFGQRSELWWDHPVAMSFEWKRTVWDIPQHTYERMRAMVCELLGLGPLMQTFARELSLGQRMRCDLGLLLLHEPELLLLDEPTLGLDVLAKQQLIAFLKHLHREDGVTILVTSHDMDDLQEMAQRLILISGGRIAFDGTFDALRGAAPAPLTVEQTVTRGAPIEQVIASLYQRWASEAAT